ncbi:MAG: response regulator [Roseiflexaceae bacterium]
MAAIRILIADDHLFYREGVRTLLKGVPEVEIVGDVTNGEDAVAQAAMLQPDIVLMDIKMPGLNGIEATRHILRNHPRIGVLVVTMFDDDETVFAAMRAGARGYLLKDADREELLRAVRAVHRGEAIFSPAIAQRMVQYFAGLSGRASASERTVDVLSRSARLFPELTEREREVLELIAQGQSNPAIAERLVLSVKTVQNHVSSILGKLQAVDRAQAIVRARDAGFGKGGAA